MNTEDALLLVESFRKPLRGEPAPSEIDFETRTVMVLVDVLDRNFDANPELKHGLTFARRSRPDIALALRWLAFIARF